jgi:O-acetyl-ADP-ribose deacetylase (regulator of RNase III)
VIDVRIQDLRQYTGEALARPVTSQLLPPTPLLAGLHAAAGEELERQLQLQEPLMVGSAFVSGPGALPVGLLVHAVVQEDGGTVTRKGVSRATLSALHRADAWGIEHLAMAPFGLGTPEFDLDASADVMLEVITTFMETGRRPRAVTILVADAAEAEAFISRILRPAR